MFKKWFLVSIAFSTMVLSGVCFAQTAKETDFQSLLSAFVSYTDLRIRSIEQSMEILAFTNEVKSGRWESMKGLLSAYQQLDDALAVWYVQPDGTYYTVDKGLMDVKLNDRSYFADLEAGRKVIGSLVVSKSTGQRSAVIAIPIKDMDRVTGAVGASLFLDKLSEQIGVTLALRPDAAFFALAADGRTALHLKTDRHFLDPRELGSETLKKAANEMLANLSGATTYEFDNATKKVIYRTSPLTQWKFAITCNVAPEK